MAERVFDPNDAWGRFARGRDRFGRAVWLRPGRAAERHPTIELLDRVDPAATGRRHRYRVKAGVRWLRVVLHGFDRQPLVSTDYLLRVDGQGPVSRTTDERGLLEEIVPAWAVHATVEVGGYTWQVAIGALVPTRQTPDEGQRGAHQRLANLGYPASAGEKVASTEAAGEESEAPFDVEVWRFQRREALASSGDIDDAVIHAAVERHRV